MIFYIHNINFYFYSMPKIKHPDSFENVISQFLREVYNTDVPRPDPYRDLVPVSYLHFLYNDWINRRGVFVGNKLPRNLFSYLMKKLDPTMHGIHPIFVFPCGRNAMRVAVFPLTKKPRILETLFPILSSNCQTYINSDSDPYIYPKLAEIDPAVRKNLLTLEKYLKRKRARRDEDGELDLILEREQNTVIIPDGSLTNPVIRAIMTPLHRRPKSAGSPSNPTSA